MKHRTSAVHVERYALLGAFALIVAGFGIATPDTYLTTGNLQAILSSQAVLLVLALGLLFPLTTGDFDLSVASTLSLSAMVVTVLDVQHGWPIVPAGAVAVLAGAAVGLVNGAVVVRLGVDSFIVTLGSGTLLLGIVAWISDSSSITGLSPRLVDWTVGHSLLGVSLSFYYGVALTVAAWALFELLPLGRRMLFVGSSRTVSALSGLRVSRIRWGSFVASGTIAAVAGILYAGNLGGADPTSGQTFLLPAFAACFLGATAIVPGRFNAIGTFIAVYFLVAGITGLQLLGVENFVQNLFYGGALIVAVALSQVVRRRRVAAG